MFKNFFTPKKRIRTEQELIKQIDIDKLPLHIAIIMDGNGRWATKRGLPRVAGHREGINSLRAIIKASVGLKLKYLTVYAFSAENWQRPPTEVNYLMGLIEEYILKELNDLDKNNIKFRVFGNIEELPENVQKKLSTAIEKTSTNTGLIFNVALNYSSRLELIDAFKGIAEKIQKGQIEIGNIDEKVISEHLYSANQPDPDLMIRTSGEFRISNFLLWQLAYAEIHVTPVLWPDFRKADFYKAIIDYQNRERRFGKVISS